MSDIVSIVRPNADLIGGIKRSFDLVGGLNLEGLPVVIKPNICVERDLCDGANTNATMVKTVIDILLGIDAHLKISIVETDSSGKWLDTAFQNNGYVEMAQRFVDDGVNVRLVNMSREPSSVIAKSKHFHDLCLPKMLLDPKYFISIARAKTHELTDITGVLKNQFGCIPPKNKMIYHNCINQAIAETNRWVRPNLCIVDAVTGMEGVVEGRRRNIGVLLCGYKPVSVDAALARVMGFDPESIKHIILTSRYGLGSIRPRIVGLPIEDVSVKFRKPSKAVRIVGRYLPEGLRPLARSVYRKIAP